MILKMRLEKRKNRKVSAIYANLYEIKKILLCISSESIFLLLVALIFFLFYLKKGIKNILFLFFNMAFTLDPPRVDVLKNF